MTQDDYYKRLVKARRAFRPSAPVATRALFAGRTKQLKAATGVISEVGRHAVVFGERGVGKTSLVQVLGLIVEADDTIFVKVGCSADDAFSSIWRKALSNIATSRSEQGAGFVPVERDHKSSVASLLPSDEVVPGDVQRVLSPIARTMSVVIVFDEFDRIDDQQTQRQMADTIKTLSDEGVDVTIVLVGVADDVETLIAEHASIERALSQIRMPRMSVDELKEIVDLGVESAELSILDGATRRITTLSQGLPHYTHLLAQAAAVAAVEHGADRIGVPHVQSAMKEAIGAGDQSLSQRYNVSVASPRANNLYAKVLLAAALTEGDELGYFPAASVREPLGAIVGRDYKIPEFTKHLHAFCEQDRGAVLQKTNLQHRNRFRFSNPMLQPYVIMRALAEKQIDLKTLDDFLVADKH